MERHCSGRTRDFGGDPECGEKCCSRQSCDRPGCALRGPRCRAARARQGCGPAGGAPARKALRRAGRSCGRGVHLRMRLPGARRREGTAAVGGNALATGRGQSDSELCGIGVPRACAHPARAPFPYPAAAASATEFEGRGGGILKTPGSATFPFRKVGHRFGPVMISRPYRAERARQPSVRTRAGQVPPGREAVRECGTDRVGPSDSTLAQPAVARRAAEQGDALLIT